DSQLPASADLRRARDLPRRGLRRDQLGRRREVQGARGEVRSLRERPALRRAAGLPLRHLVLPDRDAVHPVRHRGHLPLSRRGPAQGVRDLRARGGRRVRRAAVRRVHLRVEARSPRMEI
ncbi:MAG: NADH ubiquinone oxidoreductase chain A, partial [uncultured Solirubrobacteraceae bacterium]